MILLPLATRVLSATTGPFRSGGHHAGLFYLDIDAVTGASPTLDVKLQASSPNGDAVDIPGGAFAQKTAAGTSMLAIGLGHTAAANVAVNQLLPSAFLVVANMGTVNATREVWTVDRDGASSGDFTLDIKINTADATPGTTTAIDFDAALPAVQAAIDVVTGAGVIVATAGAGDDLVLTYQAYGPIAADAVVATDNTDAAVAATRTTTGVVTDSWTGSLTAHLI